MASTAAHAFLNMTGVQPVVQSALRPSAITMPTRHKALQRLMRGLMTLDDLTAQILTGQTALVTMAHGNPLTLKQWEHVTHMVMTQHGFKDTV